MVCTTSQERHLRERRQTPRIGFDCPLRWSDGGAERTGQTTDMSDAGMGFITRCLSAPRLGQQIQVILELDDDHEWLVDTGATVVRTRREADGHCTVGLRLSPLLSD